MSQFIWSLRPAVTLPHFLMSRGIWLRHGGRYQSQQHQHRCAPPQRQLHSCLSAILHYAARGVTARTTSVTTCMASPRANRESGPEGVRRERFGCARKTSITFASSRGRPRAGATAKFRGGKRVCAVSSTRARRSGDSRRAAKSRLISTINSCNSQSPLSPLTHLPSARSLNSSPAVIRSTRSSRKTGTDFFRRSGVCFSSRPITARRGISYLSVLRPALEASCVTFANSALR